MTTSDTRTAPAPIIVCAMEQAGTMAQTAARNIVRNLGRNRYELACALTDALGYDCFGVWRIADSNMSADRGYSTEARKHAADRRDWRTRLSDQIARLDDAAFADLIAAIADGRGPDEAARWKQATRSTVRTMTDGFAIDAADGYDVAS